MQPSGNGERQLAFAIGLRLVEDFGFPEHMFDAFMAIEQELSPIFDHIDITRDMLKKKAYGHWFNGGREDAFHYINVELPMQIERALNLSTDTQATLDSPYLLKQLRAELKKKGRKPETMAMTRERLAMNANNQRNAAASTSHVLRRREIMFKKIEANAERYRA